MSVIQIDKDGIRTVHSQDGKCCYSENELAANPKSAHGDDVIFNATTKAVKRGTFISSVILKMDKSTVSGRSVRHFSGVRGGVKKYFPAPVATDLKTLKRRAKTAANRVEAKNVLINVPKREPAGVTILNDHAIIKAAHVISLNANGETFTNEDLARYAKHCEKINDTN